MNKINRRGYTLIELLVVIAIIGILTAIGIVSYSTAQKKARDGKRKADLENIRGALEIRRTDFNTYPATIPWGGAWSEVLRGNTYTYMQNVPKDPRDPTYTYGYSSNGLTYTLCAYLEYTGATCSGGCCNSCVGAVCNYSITQP